MELFPERLVTDLARLPGGSHAYLKQICGPDGAAIRVALQRATERIGALYEERAADLLGSLDNRRFFQGFAEVAALTTLLAAGWDLAALHPPGPRIEVRSPTGEVVFLSVLAFLHQTRPGAENDTRRMLAEALGRTRSKHRFVVLVRRWLPHDFNPEPVRRAVEMWLQQVSPRSPADRYATYDDDHVSLEFCLTGERVKPKQTPVALVIGPHLAHRTLSIVEPRVVIELDRHLQARPVARPLLIACVSDQPWALTPGYVRDFLFGRPTRISVDESGTEEEYGEQSSVALFRDPLYPCAAGLLLMDRDPAAPVRVKVRAWLNPWASTPISAEALGVSAFAPTGGPAPRMRWHPGRAAVELG